MQTPEANIKITKEGEKVKSISVLMPVWNKHTEHGNLHVYLPLLGIETFAKDEVDADKAIEEAITSFCIAADKFGHGVEKELETLGWVRINGETGDPEIGYNVEHPDDLIDRLIKTGENYVNRHLELLELA